MLNVSLASPPRDIGAYTLFGSGMLLGGAFALGVLTSESGTSSTHTLYCMLWGSVVFAGFVCGMKASALYWNSVASAPTAPTIGMQGAPTPLHMRCFRVMCAPVPLCTLAAELLMLTGACFGLHASLRAHAGATVCESDDDDGSAACADEANLTSVGAGFAMAALALSCISIWASATLLLGHTVLRQPRASGHVQAEARVPLLVPALTHQLEMTRV